MQNGENVLIANDVQFTTRGNFIQFAYLTCQSKYYLSKVYLSSGCQTCFWVEIQFKSLSTLKDTVGELVIGLFTPFSDTRLMDIIKSNGHAWFRNYVYKLIYF